MKYTIPRRRSKCSGHDENFEEGAQVFSFLIPQKEYTFDRHDYCQPCWEVKGKILAEKEKVSSWKVTLPSKKSLPPLPLDLQLFDLFRELFEIGEKLEEIYLLALYLERKKILIKRGSKKENQFFEHIETGDVFSVQMQALNQDSEELLGSLITQMVQ